MKHSLALIMLVGFSLVSVFGAFAMGHGNSHGNSLCIAATAKGITCPDAFSPLMTADFYLSAIKSFSLATMSGSFVSTVLAALLALILFGIFRTVFRIYPQPLANFRLPENFTGSSFLPRRNLIYWLSLHENSPQLLAA